MKTLKGLFTVFFMLCATTSMAQFTQQMSEIKNQVKVLSVVPDGVDITHKGNSYVSESCSVKAYTCDVNVATAGYVTVNFTFTGGSHGLYILGVDLLNANGAVVYSDYEPGRVPTNDDVTKDTYTLSNVQAGDYTLRYIFCNRSSDHEVGNQNVTISVTNATKVGSDISSGTVITSVDEISSTALYTIVPQDTDRGALSAGASDSYLERNTNIDASNVAQQFMFVKRGDKTYLYCVGANKFVNDEGQYLNLTETPDHNVVVEQNAGTSFLLKMNGGDFINVSTGWSHGTVANWNTVDGGNLFTITYIEDASDATLEDIARAFGEEIEGGGNEGGNGNEGGGNEGGGNEGGGNEGGDESVGLPEGSKFSFDGYITMLHLKVIKH